MKEYSLASGDSIHSIYVRYVATYTYEYGTAFLGLILVLDNGFGTNKTKKIIRLDSL